MKFEYMLNGTGWAIGQIEINNQVCYFRVSYITNALDDLIGQFLSILPGCASGDELSDKASFDWYWEPGGLEWTLSLVNDAEIHVNIVGYPNIFEKDRSAGTVELDATCNIIEFAQHLCGMLEELLRTHGLIGYKQTWLLYDFPLSNFLRLKDFLCSKSVTDKKILLDGWREGYASNLEEELRALHAVALDQNKRKDVDNSAIDS